MTKLNKLFFTLMTKKEFMEVPKKYGRNDLCPCGSEKKFKKCHLDEYEEEKKIRSKQILK